MSNNIEFCPTASGGVGIRIPATEIDNGYQHRGSSGELRCITVEIPVEEFKELGRLLRLSAAFHKAKQEKYESTAAQIEKD